MNSPIHPDDIDPALKYAPPRVREQGVATASESSAPPVDWSWRRHGENTPAFSGDRAIMEVQRRLTLDPEWIPEPLPAAGGTDFWQIMLRAGGLLSLAAIIAWTVVSIPTIKALLGSELIGLRVPAVSHAGASVEPTQPPPPRKVHLARLNKAVEASTDGEPRPNLMRQTMQGAVARDLPVSTFAVIAALPPTAAARATPSEPERASFVTRHLGASEMESMLQRADDFIKTGDLSSARLLLRRAAESGSARAAFTLAGTFDPNVLKALGLQDGAPDIALARLWYERAATLGSADAPRRLDQLATASVQ